MTRDKAISIMQDAMQSPLGVLLMVSNVGTAVTAFDRARALRPDLSGIVFRRVSMEDGNLAVLRGEPLQSDGPAAAGSTFVPPRLPSLHEL